MTHSDMRLVPVAASLPLHPESVRIAASLRAEAKRRGRGVPSDLPGFHKDLGTAAEIIDMAEEAHAFTHQINEVLTAAPVREEGGAVDHPLYTVSEAARRQLVRAAGWIEKEAYDASGNDDPEDEGLDEAARFLRNTFDLSDEALGIVRNSSDEIVSATAPHQPQPAARAGERDYPAEFEVWWSTYKHRNRTLANYPIKKQIAFDAYYCAALRAQQPADDKLRLAVDAAISQAQWIEGFAGTSPGEREAVKIVISPIREALAALKAEPTQ